MAAQVVNLRVCPCQAPTGTVVVDKGGRRSSVCYSSSVAFWGEQLDLRTGGLVALQKRTSSSLARCDGAVKRCCSGDDVEGKADWEDSPIPDGTLVWRSGVGEAGSVPCKEEMEEDVLKEECGVVGIFGSSEASRLCHLALHSLQHRGQEGAGIAASDERTMNAITGMGLVSDVFDQRKLEELPGDSAIGHVRYATSGVSALQNVQPFMAGYKFGQVAIAHNGNIVNANELRIRLEDEGSIFNTSSDTEVVLHLIAKSAARPFIARIVDACEQLEGAYSMLFLAKDKLVAVRDPYGFRPLVMGRDENGGVVFASETCALDLIGATYEREVNPGEVVVVDKEGVSSMCLLPQRERKSCVFELIYFSSPSSKVFGRSVYRSRMEYGAILAEEAPADCDVVIPVPDSGMAAAIGYAAKAGVPYQQGLLRSHYVGRTFIEPNQKLRDLGVKLKLSPVKDILEGKRVVVVDDSIVRGTTSSKIVRMIKEAGATEVHMRIASPPIIASCYYGVDTPSREELISYRLNIEETRKQIGADSLAFLPLPRLKALGGEGDPFCYACFSGNYPVLTTAMVKKEASHKSATAVGSEVFAGVLNPLRPLFSEPKSVVAA